MIGNPRTRLSYPLSKDSIISKFGIVVLSLRLFLFQVKRSEDKASIDLTISSLLRLAFLVGVLSVMISTSINALVIERANASRFLVFLFAPFLAVLNNLVFHLFIYHLLIDCKSNFLLISSYQFQPIAIHLIYSNLYIRGKYFGCL